jgi:hypothetical protein
VRRDTEEPAEAIALQPVRCRDAIASCAVNGARRKLMYVCISRSWGIGSPASQHPILAIAMDIPISELARF